MNNIVSYKVTSDEVVIISSSARMHWNLGSENHRDAAPIIDAAINNAKNGIVELSAKQHVELICSTDCFVPVRG